MSREKMTMWLLARIYQCPVNAFRSLDLVFVANLCANHSDFLPAHCNPCQDVIMQTNV